MGSRSAEVNCVFGQDMISVSDICIVVDKVNGLEGSQTDRCALALAAPEGFTFHPDLVEGARKHEAGEDKTAAYVLAFPTKEEEPDFFLRGFPNKITQAVACKTGRGVGSNCRQAASLTATAISKACFKPDAKFSIQ